jgi:hypothetical protein
MASGPPRPQLPLELETLCDSATSEASASEPGEAEEVLGVPLPACDQAAVGLKPGEEALDQPAALGAAERSAVLGLAARAQVGSDELDAALQPEASVQVVAVIGPVAESTAGSPSARLP